MTGTCDIRRHSDGSIDYDFYRAGAAALRRQAIQDPSMRRLSLRSVTMQVTVLAFAILAASAVGPQRTSATGEHAEARTQVLRQRIDILSASDPQRWWQGYGKTTTRGQEAAIAELRRQLAAAESRAEGGRRAGYEATRVGSPKAAAWRGSARDGGLQK